LTLEPQSQFEIDKLISKSNELGFSLENYKSTFIKRRVDARIRINKINTYDEYLKLIEENHNEFSALLRNLSINVTEFFRDSQVFNLLNSEIIPQLISNKKNIAICSAGCASGEEAYTLAIICNELQSSHKFNFLIHALDRNKNALDKGKLGIYSKNSIKNISAKLLNKYFICKGENYKINESLKKCVNFYERDLLEENTNNSFDLILCRNVIIYFDKSARQKIFNNFFKSLNKSGFLIIGLSEILDGKSHSLYKPIYSRERIYQKSD